MELSLHDRDNVGVQDFVLLEDYQSEEAFVGNLKKRFNGNLIYTYIGNVLISVNPYKDLPIYTNEKIDQYRKWGFIEAPAHLFAITDLAYRSLLEERREQCILISGESGSGKTEASKKILHFIAAASGHQDNIENVKNKLLRSNPVLEAFGNAKTNKNDNSSRFGKYMDICFNFMGDPIGGNILNYLLEKSRVVYQNPGERNFHVFYQLLAGADEELIDHLFLSRNIEEYYYLRQHKNRPKSLHDTKTETIQFKEVRQAMTTIQFHDHEQKEIFEIIASVLHIGNVCFEDEDEKSQIVDLTHTRHVAQLLGCDVQQLEKALTHRTIEAREDKVTSPLNKELAMYARDALAKAVYDRLFSWLVERLNKSLQPIENTTDRSVMGILDIYGFEVFEKNSFEQFCINFCNEKLQQLFIELTLKSEQEEYEKEGIEWVKIDFFNNKIICDLVEEKHKGIIAIMDEECLRPGDPTDATFLHKMDSVLDTHEHYISHKKSDTKIQKTMGRDEFRLIHYAGEVTYNVRGFLDKNNDLLFRDLREVMTATKNSITQAIFTEEELNSKRRPETAVTQFKNSVNKLMGILGNKEPSYVRCIKPNDYKQPSEFDEDVVKHQVKYLGLMENLRVRRAGFAYRRPYEDFLQRYKCLCPKTWPNYRGSAKNGVQTLVDFLKYEKDEYRMGRTKIFIRSPKTLFTTEDAYQLRKHFVATIIQKIYKGKLQRRKYLKMREAAIVIQKHYKRRLARKRVERMRDAVDKIRRFIKGFITRNGPITDINKRFVALAKAQWLIRLSKRLPKNVLDKYWPPCPESCKEASKLLQDMHTRQLALIYRRSVTDQKKIQFEQKVLAESLFKGKKKSYKKSVKTWFKNNKLEDLDLAIADNFQKEALSNETVIYRASVKKYDRHGYKIRDRVLFLTDKHLFLLSGKNKTYKKKHALDLEKISELVVTSEVDQLLVVKIPLELKKDKGDLILMVPHVIELISLLLFHVKKTRNLLKIVDTGSISHQMLSGKSGTIKVQSGTEHDIPAISKDKKGQLIVVA